MHSENLAILAILMVFGIGLLVVVLGKVIVNIMREYRRNHPKSSGLDGGPVDLDEEARIVQEMALKIDHMANRIANLEDILLDTDKARGHKGDQA